MKVQCPIEEIDDDESIKSDNFTTNGTKISF